MTQVTAMEVEIWNYFVVSDSIDSYGQLLTHTIHLCYERIMIHDSTMGQTIAYMQRKCLSSCLLQCWALG